MIFGILKESGDERRVSILPEAVESLIKLGHSVQVESKAGDLAYSSDEDYKKSGATVVSKLDVLKNAEVYIKIGLPDNSEVEGMKAGSLLIATLQPVTNKDLIQKLANKKVNVFSMDTIPRITLAQSMDVLSSMSTVSGYKAVLLAASHLPRFFPMLTTAAGTIAPAKVLIIGAGVAGLQAIATSRRLGAVVEVFDTRPEVKEQVQSLGAKFVEVEGAADASKAGGYAVEQSEEYKARQKEAISKSAVKSDVIITTALIPGKKAPVIITKEMVQGMRPGSLIIDLAAAAGGNCELTENNNLIEVHGVIIIGNSNLPSLGATDASKMYGKNILNLLKHVSKEGKINFNFNDEITSGTCTVHDGVIRHAPTLQALGK